MPGSWMRKLTMYTLAIAGATIARKPGESKRGPGSRSAPPYYIYLFILTL
jgi:hypothetical protein